MDLHRLRMLWTLKENITVFQLKGKYYNIQASKIGPMYINAKIAYERLDIVGVTYRSVFDL
jgi:hypothetical protein